MTLPNTPTANNRANLGVSSLKLGPLETNGFKVLASKLESGTETAVVSRYRGGPGQDEYEDEDYEPEQTVTPRQQSSHDQPSPDARALW